MTTKSTRSVLPEAQRSTPDVCTLLQEAVWPEIEELKASVTGEFGTAVNRTPARRRGGTPSSSASPRSAKPAKKV